MKLGIIPENVYFIKLPHEYQCKWGKLLIDKTYVFVILVTSISGAYIFQGNILFVMFVERRTSLASRLFGAETVYLFKAINVYIHPLWSGIGSEFLI